MQANDAIRILGSAAVMGLLGGVGALGYNITSKPTLDEYGNTIESNDIDPVMAALGSAAIGAVGGYAYNKFGQKIPVKESQSHSYSQPQPQSYSEPEPHPYKQYQPSGNSLQPQVVVQVTPPNPMVQYNPMSPQVIQRVQFVQKLDPRKTSAKELEVLNKIATSQGNPPIQRLLPPANPHFNEESVILRPRREAVFERPNSKLDEIARLRRENAEIQEEINQKIDRTRQLTQKIDAKEQLMQKLDATKQLRHFTSWDSTTIPTLSADFDEREAIRRARREVPFGKNRNTSGRRTWSDQFQ